MSWAIYKVCPLASQGETLCGWGLVIKIFGETKKQKSKISNPPASGSITYCQQELPQRTTQGANRDRRGPNHRRRVDCLGDNNQQKPHEDQTWDDHIRHLTLQNNQEKVFYLQISFDIQI